MDNQFTIKLGVDNSGAKDAVKQSIFDFKKLAEAGKEAARVMDYEGTRAAKEIADAAKKSAAEQQAAADASRQKWVDGFKEAGGAASGFLKQLLGIGTAIAVFNKLGEALRAVKEIMDDVTNRQNQNVSKLNAARTLVRDLAAMQGTTPTDAYVRQFLGTASKTGLAQPNAAAFMKELVGAGESVKGNIAEPGGYQRYSEQLGKFAALQGGGVEDSGTYGRMGGILLGIGKYNSADEALAANMTLTNQISAGVGSNPELARQATRTAGVFMNEQGKGRIRNATELGALIATASRVNPEDAAMRLQMSSKLLYGLNDKHGGMLRQAGIGESDQLTDAYQKLFKHLEGVEKSGRNVQSYLDENDVDTRSSRSLVEMYNYRNFLGQQLKVAPVAAGDANRILSERLAADPGVRLQMAQNRTEAETVEGGMQYQHRQFLDEEVERRLRAKGLDESSAYGQGEALKYGQSNMLEHIGEGNTAYGFRVLRDIERAKIAEEHGLKIPGRPEMQSRLARLTGGYNLNPAYSRYLTTDAADAAETLASTLQLSGQSPGDGRKIVDALDRNTEANQEVAKELREQRPKVMAPADVPRNVPR